MNAPDLDNLLSKASATALVLVRGGAAIGTAGDLNAESTDAICKVLQRYWLAQPACDLNRYVGVALDHQYHLMFAKFLPQGGGLLGMVFPLQTPLIRIRQDMTDLMRAVIEWGNKHAVAVQPVERSLRIDDKSASLPDRSASPMEMGWRPEADQYIAQGEIMSMASESTITSDEPVADRSVSGARYLTFGAPMKRHEDDILSMDYSGKSDSATGEIQWQPLDEGIAPEEQYEPSPILSGSPETGRDLAQILHGELELPGENERLSGGWQGEQDSILAVGDSSGEASALIPNETRTAGWGEDIVDVTLYLVPRGDEHYLVGSLSWGLRGWLPEICEKYGWDLRSLSIRPGYLKWTLSDFPESILPEMLHIVREETSSRISSLLPEPQEGTRGMDFWAPGYLADVHDRDFTTQVLMARVARNRLELTE